MASLWDVRPYLIAAGVSVCLLLQTSGCSRSGPERASIAGTITINGEAVPIGTITFSPWRGTRGPRSSTQILNGQYAIDSERGPLVGEMQVRLSVPVLKPGQTVPDKKMDISRLLAEADERLPKEFHQDSQIGCTVKSGDNRFDYDIQIKPKGAPR
jgi:hypothetical protein